MNKSESIVKIAEAFVGFQSEMPAVAFDATNPFLKNKYASYGAIVEAARPYLAKWGLGFAQFPISNGDTGEPIGLETVILHKSGEWFGSTFYLPTGEEKGKSDAQVAGSTITYMKRYGLSAALGIYADADTDGNKPVAKGDWKPVEAKIEPEIKAEAKVEAVATVTLEDALKHLNSQNVPYGDLESNTLKIMWNAMAKSISKNHLEGEKKAELEYKMRLCKMITDAREAGEIADK